MFLRSSYVRPVTLRAALEERYNGEALRRLAQALGVVGPGRKADLATGIAAAVLGLDDSSRRSEDLFARLTDIEKAAVAEALFDENHTFDAARFHAKYGSVPVWCSPRRTREGTTLVGLFLLPGKSDREPDQPFIPADLATRLRTFVPEPLKEMLGCLEEAVSVNDDLTLTVVDTEQAASQELFAVLQLVDMGKIQVSAQTRRGHPQAAELQPPPAIPVHGFLPDVPPDSGDAVPTIASSSATSS